MPLQHDLAARRAALRQVEPSSWRASATALPSAEELAMLHERAKEICPGALLPFTKRFANRVRKQNQEKQPSLQSLVAPPGSALEARLRGVCCCCSNVTICGAGRFPDAFLLQSGQLDGTSSSVTIFVSSSPRPYDAGEENAQRVLAALRSVRVHAGLATSRALIDFDGLDGKPGATTDMRRKYASKIARVVQSASALSADVLVHESWQHQANSLRCAMRTMPHTPLVFVIQDDAQLAAPVDVAALVPLMLPAATRSKRRGGSSAVEYVRMASAPDCEEQRGRRMRRIESLKPCTPHPRTPLLQHSWRWTDRPHVATRAHYEAILFAWLPYDAKVTPEQVLDEKVYDDRVKGPRGAEPWPLWLYGRRGDMLRDLHWPVPGPDGKLVSYEKRARNESKYVHSYLIHAYYTAGSQNVGPDQVACRSFRPSNPDWMVNGDNITSDA